jgi:hypothetical protein
MNTSNFIIGTVLSQKEETTQLPAFDSPKIIVIELEYNIYYQEISAIISVFKKWKRYSEDIQHHILVFLVNKILEYCATTNVLNQHWAR